MSGHTNKQVPAAWIIRYPDGVVISVVGEIIPKVYEKYAQPLFSESNASELSSAYDRIAKLEALVAERDAMLGRRPCQNSRCNELNAARALLRETVESGNMRLVVVEKVQAYLDACDKPGEKK